MLKSRTFSSCKTAEYSGIIGHMEGSTAPEFQVHDLSGHQGNGRESSLRRKSRRRHALLVALLLVVWFSGSVGWLVRTLAVKTAPREGRDYQIAAIGNSAFADPATGIVLRVSAARLKQLAHEALGWKAYVIPPGTVPERLSASGSVRVHLADGAAEVWVPFVINIQPDAPHPKLNVRLPSGMVNEALLYEDSFAHKDKRKQYSLGHYNIIHSLRFDTVTLQSTPDNKRPITFRRIAGVATGQVQFKLKENLFNARTTARVKKMDLRCDLDLRKYVDGLSLSYKITIPKLDADINNLAPMFEGAPVEAIRQALEESIARPKNLEKVARRRLPLYLPLDLELDIDVFNAP